MLSGRHYGLSQLVSTNIDTLLYHARARAPRELRSETESVR